MASCTLVGNSIGFFTGALFQDPKRASGMAPLLLLPLMMFSGLYNKLNDIPGWIAWMQYVSPFRYGLHMLLVNQYGDFVVWGQGGLSYDYRQDLGVDMGWVGNWGVMAGLAALFYTLGFVLLKKLTQQLSV